MLVSVSRFFFTLAVAYAILGSLAENASCALIGYYPFDGSANDASEQGNHGTVTGATLTAAGHTGMGYEFDGSGEFNSVGDFISVPININPAIMPQLTMGAWVLPYFGSPTSDRYFTVLSHDDGDFDRSLLFESRGGLNGWSAFAGLPDRFIGSVDVVANEWVFLAVVYDHSMQDIRLYVNDQEIQGAGLPGPSQHEYTHIGGNPGFGVRFDGIIDQVFFYNEALTAEQITNIRENGVRIPAPSAGLLAATCVWSCGLTRKRRGSSRIQS